MARSFLLAAFVYAIACVTATPVSWASKRSVWVPHITSPSACDTWKAGSIQNITWEVNPPSNPTSTSGMVVLGFFDDADPNGGEHLDIKNPLAKDVDLLRGFVEVTVPSVHPKDTYIIALFGDSGNVSPEFSIADTADTSRKDSYQMPLLVNGA